MYFRNAKESFYTVAKIWQPTPVLLPGQTGKLQSMGSLRVGHDW